MYLLKIAAVVFFLGSGAVQGPSYRIVHKEKFQIVDTAGFYLYKINKLVQGEKIARPADVYYFSVNAEGPIEELTRANLENAFAGNARFRYALEAQFSRDGQLTAYDPLLKAYKVKYIYSQSLH